MTEWQWTGASLRAALKKRGRTQVWLAERLGVKRQQINAYLSARRRPLPEQLRAICVALGCSADELLEMQPCKTSD